MSQIQNGGRQTGSTSRVLYLIPVKFQRVHPCLQEQSVQWHALRCRTVIGIYRVQYGGRQTGSSYNLRCIIARNVIPKATTMFSRIANHNQTNDECG